jgi:hypothetical protein
VGRELGCREPRRHARGGLLVQQQLDGDDGSMAMALACSPAALDTQGSTKMQRADRGEIGSEVGLDGRTREESGD